MDVQKSMPSVFTKPFTGTEKRDAKIAVQENEIALLDTQNKIKSNGCGFWRIGP